ncbi:unnamed protein product, partial [Brenthis ino]
MSKKIEKPKASQIATKKRQSGNTIITSDTKMEGQKQDSGIVTEARKLVEELFESCKEAGNMKTSCKENILRIAQKLLGMLEAQDMNMQIIINGIRRMEQELQTKTENAIKTMTDKLTEEMEKTQKQIIESNTQMQNKIEQSINLEKSYAEVVTSTVQKPKTNTTDRQTYNFAIGTKNTTNTSTDVIEEIRAS